MREILSRRTFKRIIKYQGPSRATLQYLESLLHVSAIIGYHQ
jgi:hypothetical protein